MSSGEMSRFSDNTVMVNLKTSEIYSLPLKAVRGEVDE
jgi:hypothetical protein